jgi:hypothetical protein
MKAPTGAEIRAWLPTYGPPRVFCAFQETEGVIHRIIVLAAAFETIASHKSCLRVMLLLWSDNRFQAKRLDNHVRLSLPVSSGNWQRQSESTCMCENKEMPRHIRLTLA